MIELLDETISVLVRLVGILGLFGFLVVLAFSLLWLVALLGGTFAGTWTAEKLKERLKEKKEN